MLNSTLLYQHVIIIWTEELIEKEYSSILLNETFPIKVYLKDLSFT